MKAKKAEKILASITDTGAKEVSKFYELPIEQIRKAFNVFDNYVLSGEAEVMSITAMGMAFRQCVDGASAATNPMIWNQVAREFKLRYNELRRKVWK